MRGIRTLGLVAAHVLSLSCGASEAERRPAPVEPIASPPSEPPATDEARPAAQEEQPAVEDTSSGAGETPSSPTGQSPMGDDSSTTGTTATGQSGEGTAGPSGSGAAEEGVNEVSNEVAEISDSGEDFVVPTQEGGRYVFRGGATELEVDPAIGGRVTRFSIDGREVLTGPDVVASGPDVLPNMFGSTFWTSPQSDWGWPPEPELDSAAHPATLEGHVLALSSPPGARTGYGVDKRFQFDVSRNVVRIDYALVNYSASAPAAPWEVTRVPKTGLVFFPSEAAPAPESTVSSQTVNGVAWLDVDQVPAGDVKLFQDGSEGWLAYVNDDVIFIKTFQDVPQSQQASGEAEVEVFVSGGFGYVEVEQQGPYELVPSGESSTWSVRWILRRRPVDVSATLGSSDLVDWVRAEIAAAVP